MKNKYYNIFFTSERDGQGRTFRLASYSLYLGIFACVVMVIFSYIGFSYIVGQDKLSQELKELRQYKKAVEPMLIQKGIKKEIVKSNNLEQLIIDYFMANELPYPEDPPVDGIVTKGIIRNDGDIIYSGIDIASESKNDIRSPLPGKVEFVGHEDVLGNYIILKHDNNFKTVYGYLHSTLVKFGEVIDKGEIIAQVGASTNDENPHLYFEIRNGDIIIDPRNLIIDYKENDVSIR